LKAAVYSAFNGAIEIQEVADPAPDADGVVIRVHATGICRSDWHGWAGHDADIQSFPHVPGHEFAGVIAEVGSSVHRWKVGQRVTMPFVAGCGACRECLAGAPQVCDDQFQPGFTAWGALAEAVAVRYADFNLVALPEELDFATAASLGCRLATAYRAVVQQGAVAADEWVAVHGCGGLGLSAVMVASALGARVIGVDVQPQALALAEQMGAIATIDAAQEPNLAGAIQSLTDGGAQLSLDTLGSATTAVNSIRCLRKQGRHVQVGLLAGGDASPKIPLELVISRELQILGSHGLAAADYPGLLTMATDGRIAPANLIRRRIELSEAPAAIREMGQFGGVGMTVVNQC
jgi:alcohol dehydrogenase